MIHLLFITIQRLQKEEEEIQAQREWVDLVIEELYMFISVIIYIGIYIEPDISIY